jgi:hypothetical protein
MLTTTRNKVKNEKASYIKSPVLLMLEQSNSVQESDI